MLRKLMKYEFKALLPPLGIMYAIVAVLALTLTISTTGYNSYIYMHGDYLLTIILSLIFTIAQPTMFIVLLVLLIGRLSSNLLGDEGYIMMTLPVSIHKLLWAKLFAAMICFVLTCIVSALTSILLVASQNIADGLAQIFSVDFLVAMGQYTPQLIESLILFFALFFAFGLGIYAAVSLGYTFQKKQLMSVVFCFLLYVLSQTFWTTLYMQSFGLFEPLLSGIPTDMLGHLAILVPALINALFAVAFYFFTVHNLSKKLNLP